MKKITFTLGLSFLLAATSFAGPVATGELVLPTKFADQAKGIHTVFISLYDPASPRPMPCAAQKLELKSDAKGTFLKFNLTTESLMLMACQSIPEKFNLKAKLDKDGSAGDSTGDIVGKKEGVKNGTKNLVVTLDTIL